MALDSECIRSRLKETFGSEQQEIVAGRLNVTQGTISKVLTGNQTPTLEMLYHVAREYSVSVDWLLGLSDDKHNHKSTEVTYGTAVMDLLRLVRCGAVEEDKGQDRFKLRIKDVLLQYLYKKGRELYHLDQGFYDEWINDKVSAFDDKPVLGAYAWSYDSILYLAGEAVNEENWLEVYDQAKSSGEEIAKSMDDTYSPFGE